MVVETQAIMRQTLLDGRMPSHPASRLSLVRPEPRCIDLVLLLGDCEGVRERRHYSAAIADLSLRYDTVISVVPMGIDEYRLGKTPFLLNVRKEGVGL